jgi:hypothetical protein
LLLWLFFRHVAAGTHDTHTHTQQRDNPALTTE